MYKHRYIHANIQTYIKTVLATLTQSSLFLIKEMTKTMHTTHIHTTLLFTLSLLLPVVLFLGWWWRWRRPTFVCANLFM